MTRRFLDNVRADINSLLADNATGDISASDMRLLLLDSIDSTIQDESAISSTSVSTGIATTTAFVALTTVFDIQAGGDGNFLNPSFATGEILSSATPGFTYIAYANLTVVDASNQDPIEAVIMLDGVPIGVPQEETGQGNNDPVSFSLRAYVGSAPVNGSFKVGIRTPAGADVVDVNQADLALVIQPTNNP